MSHLNNSNDLAAEYDRGIVPAKVAARKQREAKNFGHLPNEFEQINSASIHMSDGYLIDLPGLLNNYAVEPEGNVVNVWIYSYLIVRPNSYRLMNNPITASCISSVLEKQIVLLANRLIRVLNVRCLRSIR